MSRVQRGQDLIRLDVGLRLGQRDRRTLLHLALRRCPDRSRSSCPGGRCAGAAAGWRRDGSAARTCCRCPSSRRRCRSRALTPPTVPTLIPAIVICWPCPGVTACAVRELGLELEVVGPEDRDPGWEVRGLLRPGCTPVVTIARTTRIAIATKSRRCSRIARLTGPPSGLGGTDRPGGAVEVRNRLRVARDVHPERRRGDAVLWGAAGGCPAAREML